MADLESAGYYFFLQENICLNQGCQLWGFIHTKKQILGFLSKTFWAFLDQYMAF
jgi:hypothetical protein